MTPPLSPRSRRLLAIILLVAAIMRIGLALQGGQYFFHDEGRYSAGVTLYQAARHGDWAALGAQLMRPEHAAFNYLNALVAAVHHALAQFTAYGDWTVEPNIAATAQLAAAVLALFSVLNIWLVHRLARAAGAGEAEALWAALLAAASNTLFYYSRHLQPYDAALAAALGGLILAMPGGSPTRHRWSGALAALTYQTYNGYWFLVPVILIALLYSQPDWPARIQAGVQWMAGCFIATIIMMLPGVIFGGDYYWRMLLYFGGSANQGLFSEGWSLPGEYLWHSEGWLGVAVLAAAAYALLQIFRPGADAGRARRWWLLLGAAYLLPVAACVGAEKFMMYGRTCRPLVPFFCLLGGWTLQAVVAHRPRVGPALAGLIVAGALLMAAPHYGRVFPRELERTVLKESGVPKRWVTFSGTIYLARRVPAQRPDLALVNPLYLYPVRDYYGYPEGTPLLSVENPLAYLPYQYEGHTPRERRLLREHPPLLQLVRLAHPAQVPDHPPAAVTFTEADRADGHDHAR